MTYQVGGECMLCNVHVYVKVHVMYCTFICLYVVWCGVKFCACICM